MAMVLPPEFATICILSFEGPDRYSLAGGLGVRVTHLAETLARRGFETHLLFVGDPYAPSEEIHQNGKLTLHRWCQWISAYHPVGVYEGEEAKLRDFNKSVPPFLIEHIIRPALQAGKLPVVLAEEWHTAEALIHLSDELHATGLRKRCVLFWNANNTMSFHRVDWSRLNFVAQLTTVSRYMKHLMWDMELNPLVIPNGIPERSLEPVAPSQVAELRRALTPVDREAWLLFKVGRFDPSKRWLMAVEAAAQLKAEGERVVFALRGGIEPHGYEVMAVARDLGQEVAKVIGDPESEDEVIALMRTAPPADIYDLGFFMNESILRLFYAAADTVLANSGHEPFGLVGLEAMAAGGLVFTGATGEEYTLGGQTAVMLDTDRPQEIVSAIRDLRMDPARAAAMRAAARERAAQFTWEQVTDILLEKIKFIGEASGAMPRRMRMPEKRYVGMVPEKVPSNISLAAVAP
ncbi:MAG TPA: glycosyltransferase family 4 protein [Anaerolineales bacterium]|jgi:glycosyltransferase involved in cell wall biosynthesis|nr:glycosyltransferase family 4 protein [Anaerolineales bacterium]